MMPQQPQQPPYGNPQGAPPGGGYGPPGGGYGGPPQQQREKHGNATIAMWLGIAGLGCIGLTGIPALIMGLKAKKEIDAQPGRYSNGGQALVGIIAGGCGCGFVALFVLASVLGHGNKGAAANTPTESPSATVEVAAAPTTTAATRTKTPPAAAPTAEAPAAAPSGPKIGDMVKFDDSEWTVVEAKLKGKRLASNNQFQEAAKTDGKFIYVKFKVKNLTNKEERIGGHPKLVDGKGREFGDYDGASFYIGSNEKTIALEALPSSMGKQFAAIYEVPDDATNLSFQARGLGIFGDKKLISLGF
jgi:hypothetical protein